jgi:membrane associated rhomboid family serine protease
VTPWVKRLIIANVAVFIATAAMPALYGWLALVPFAILARPWTLFTYMFVHADFWHILFNMLGLFFFGPRLEIHLGERDFALLYFLSGLGGAVLSFFFAPTAAVVGASGAVFGILLGFARYWPHEPVYIWGVLPVPARVLVAAMAALSTYFGITGSGGNIAHFAHLGGFVAGWLFLRFHDRRRGRGFRGSLHRKPSPLRKATDGIRPETRRWESIRLDQLHPINREEVERIREKIRTGGFDSLSLREREFMDRMSGLG